MSDTHPLGTVVTNPRARQIIYGLYVASALIVGATVGYFVAVETPIPDALVGAQAVVAYLAIPIGALAIVNTPAKEGN